MDYHQALEYLLSFSDFERSGGFSPRSDVLPVRALLRRLGEPQTGRLTVHVAGSKGKGSTAAMMASVLRESGRRVGLYTSPHLHSICERFRLDGEPIPREAFARYAAMLPGALDAVSRELPERKLVTFDLLTAMAFLAFAEAYADVQVVETGLGGRVDSTNAMERKEVCVITSLSLEHQAILGDTLAQIAAEKAGIITPGAQVVLASQKEDVGGVIRRACRERGATLVEADAVCSFERRCAGIEGQELTLRTPRAEYDLWLPLLGPHQAENAVAAVLAVEALRDWGVEVSKEQVRDGLAKVRWPGRLEVLGREPLLLADGAHNEESAARLRETLTGDLGFSEATFVVGVSKDKDTAGIERQLRPMARRLIATSSRHPRALAAEQVATAFSPDGLRASPVASVPAAVDAALAEAGRDGLICVVGSLFVAAEARAHVLGVEHEVIGG